MTITAKTSYNLGRAAYAEGLTSQQAADIAERLARLDGYRGKTTLPQTMARSGHRDEREEQVSKMNREESARAELECARSEARNVLERNPSVSLTTFWRGCPRLP